MGYLVTRSMFGGRSLPTTGSQGGDDLGSPCSQPHRLQAWLWLAGWHRGLPAPPWPRLPGDRAPPREEGALPPPRPHLGSRNKVQRRKRKTTPLQRLPCHAALPLGTQGPRPQSPSQNSPLNPLGLPTASQHRSERGHLSPGVTGLVHEPAAVPQRRVQVPTPTQPTL